MAGPSPKGPSQDNLPAIKKRGAKPGEVRNPQGRRGKVVPISTRLRQSVRDQIQKSLNENNLDLLDEVIKIVKSLKTSNKDRLNAIRLLMEYQFGKPSQHLDIKADTEIHITVGAELSSLFNVEEIPEADIEN